jgi:hypothetical protein
VKEKLSQLAQYNRDEDTALEFQEDFDSGKMTREQFIDALAALAALAALVGLGWFEGYDAHVELAEEFDLPTSLSLK